MGRRLDSRGMPAALYRRYRPETFAELIGQEHVTGPLQQALKADRVHHAYLFSGPRGCGKTTSARILARCLNCEQGPTDTPCGTCDSCVGLARNGSGSMDVVEIDAASHGGVDDARDLRERAVFAPASSRYKIYIIDEAHMVSSAGFNALLKLVEEPPEHVKFIFATTEPDKVIGTIRSRTHHYPFRLVPPGVLQNYLAQVCQQEGVQIEAGVLPLVARAGAGSVRDSLSVLDQLLAGAGELGLDCAQASALLGYTDTALLDEVVQAFAAGQGAATFAVIDKVMEAGADPRRFAEDVLQRLRDLIVVQAVGADYGSLSAGLLGQLPADQLQRMCQQAASFGPASLTRAAEVFNAGLVAMRGVTAARLHLELLCAHVLLPAVDAGELGVLARLEQLERGRPVAAPNPPAGEPAAATPPPAPAVVETPTEPNPSAATGPTAAPAPTGLRVSAVMAAVTGTTTAHELPAEPAPPAPPEPPASLDLTTLRHRWPQVLERLKAVRRFTWSLVSQNAGVHSLEGNTVMLAFLNPGARDRFLAGDNTTHVRRALQEELSGSWQVEALVDPSAVGVASSTTAVAPSSTVQPSAAQPKVAAGTPPWVPATPPANPPHPPAGASDAVIDLREPPAAEPSFDDEDIDAESTLDLLQRDLGAQVIDEMTLGER